MIIVIWKWRSANWEWWLLERGGGGVNRTGSELKTPITLLVKLLYPEVPVPTLAQTWIIFIRTKWAIFSEFPTYVCSFPLNATNCKPENTLHRSTVILTQNGGVPNLGAREWR
jgi:hypothetical protein